MSRPQGTDYQEAVQNPRIAFTDPDLKRCQCEETPLRLPKPYSGGFTVTYHLYDSKNDWAVRCFTREIAHLQKRYQEISRFLARNSNGVFVNAEYLPEGILVNGQRFPIIKMPWVKGEPLNEFIGKNVSRQGVLSNLAERFKKLVDCLQALGVAHGDLQHGNIIVKVKTGDLYLIDYDGMFLPSLKDLPTNEIGHVNYQHPARDASHYDASIDRFSAIVIYLGLKAISVAPHLWGKYDNDENILFRQEDFREPERSQLLQEMSSMPALQPLVDKFKAVCRIEFTQVPTLEQFLTPSFVIHRPVSTPAWVAGPLRNQYATVDAKKSRELLAHVGSRIQVVGQIVQYSPGYTRFKDPYVFLNFGHEHPDQTFTLVVWSDALGKFGRQNVDLEEFEGKWVCVTGVVSNFRGKPQIVVEMPSQIRVLSGEDEAQQLLGVRQQKPEQRAPNPAGSAAVERSTAPGTAAGAQRARPQAPPTQSPPTIQAPWVLGRGKTRTIQTIPTQFPVTTQAGSARPITKREADVLNQLYGGKQTAPPQRAPAHPRVPQPGTAPTRKYNRGIGLFGAFSGALMGLAIGIIFGGGTLDWAGGIICTTLGAFVGYRIGKKA